MNIHISRPSYVPLALRSIVGSLIIGALYASSAIAQDIPSDRVLADIRAHEDAIQKQLTELKGLVQTLLLQTAKAPRPPQLSLARGTEVNELNISDLPAKGSETAAIGIVEFSDYQCPFCARHYRETLSSIQHEYVDTGRVRYFFKNLPLTTIHRGAIDAAVAAECAGGQAQYWQMHDQLFLNQRALAHDDVQGYASAIGLDIRVFNDCLRDVRVLDKVRHDMTDAVSLDIQSTPTFLAGPITADGHMKIVHRIDGAQPYASFASALQILIGGNSR
jgi:protein-disulfide isomerase